MEVVLDLYSQEHSENEPLKRIPCAAKLSTELAAWQKQRNCTASKVIWRFTTEDARLKLKHLYPLFETEEIAKPNALV